MNPMKPVMAADTWRTNADLVADLRRLGYLDDDHRVLDPTYGRGKWWTKWRPADFTSSDQRTGVDFRDLPHDDDTFDVVTFDPPYVCKGGRTTSTIPDFDDRYGLADAPRTAAALQALIDDGLAECARVTKPGGRVLVKCQDYVSSGGLWLGVNRTIDAAQRLGLVVEDVLHHLRRPGPQPPHRRQVHARRNLSTLLVLKKGKRR